MSVCTVALSQTTYERLERKALQSGRTPDQVADELLQHQLAPKHAYVEVIEGPGGSQAVLKGTRIPVSILIGYFRIGETPETLAENILPHLSLAQIYDALSYYHDHEAEIEREMAENTEEHGRRYLRQHLGEEGYLRITGQLK